MPTPDESVSLLIGGRVHQRWSSYEIDSDLLIPADAWQVELPPSKQRLPAIVKAGASVQVRIGNDTVMTGFIDQVSKPIAKNKHILSINGRDRASILTDCSAPIFAAKQATLAEVVANVVRPLGISKIRIDAANAHSAEKVQIEPGETGWDALVHAAEANGLWPWFEADGTLVIGGPDYSTPPVASLVLKYDGKGNNVIDLNPTWCMAERYSEITVLGQAHGTSVEAGKHALKATVRDESVTVYRPKIVIDHDIENLENARAKARKLLSDSRLKGFTMTAEVKGHRTSNGVLWTPGQRVHVISEPDEIDGVFFMMARKFRRDRGQGTRTIMTLKEDGVWVLDAHPHKKHGKKRGKKNQEVAIVDVG